MGAWRELLDNEEIETGDNDKCMSCGATEFDKYEHCTACGQNRDDYEGANQANVDAGRKGSRVAGVTKFINGLAGEIWVKAKFKNDGYATESLNRFNPETEKEEFNRQKILRFLAGHKEEKKILDLLKENPTGLPDIIMLKGDVISFCEVKANGSELSDNQKRVKQVLEENEFKFVIKKVKVSVEEVSEGTS